MALGQHVSGSHENLKRVLDKGLVVTTHYSGTGAAEMALAKIAPGRVKFHSACDLDPICQAVLLNHPMECAAEHVSKDLCQRPPPHIVDALRAELQKHHARLAARASTSSEIALEWVDAAMNILRSWTPRREDGAFCVRHGQHCPAFPARGASTPEPLHLEIDGINCQPWTTAGKKLGWLDSRSIPCLILVRTILCVEPDAICLECTPKFDFATLKRLLHTYRGNYAITCPTDFGRPVARRRMYMWFDLLSSLDSVCAEVGTILDVSARSLLVGPEVFLTASASDVRRCHYEMAQRASQKDIGLPKPVPRRLVGKQPPRMLTPRSVLGAGDRTRYEGHRKKVELARGASTSAGCHMVDINRTPGWGGAPQCHHVPTILRSSKLMVFFQEEEQDRLLLPAEMPAMHGLHLPKCVMDRVPARGVRSLVGNSMHVAQVGCFVQYALATRSYARGDETS